ncbi:uncharacterized protein LOC135162642 [Diachasmimorpha longicaudata]|uniref:uncharacterized protein LOC135162642 n=1 Tax=Diachasmimorpha longicaudata TaxID=58733 RepID=UPI0030B8D906
MHPPQRLTSLFTLILYIFFKILGLAPFTVHINAIKKSPIISFSRLGTFYNIILIVIVILLSPSSMVAIDRIEYEGKTSTTRGIALAKAVIGLAVLVIVWLYIIFNQKSTARIAYIWQQMDETMRTLAHMKYRSLSRIQVPVYFALNVFIWINIIWTDLMEFEKWFKATFVAIIIPSFVFTWLMLEYTFILILLRDRFRALNEKLNRISSVAFVVPYYCDSAEWSLDGIISKDLLIIKMSHEILYELVCNISNLYSFPILLVISVLSGMVIYSSYYFFMMLMLTDNVKLLIIFNSVCYISMEMFPIIALSFGVTKIINEIKLTPVAIHKLLTRSFVKSKVKSQLKLFSLELLHRNISFTGGNIFSLDGTLLHSILNTTATYLVILYQFAQSDKTISSTNCRITNKTSSKSFYNLSDSLADITHVNDELMINHRSHRVLFGLSVQKMIYLFFKVIGLLPFTVKLQSEHSKKMEISFLGLVYNGILIIVTLVLSVPAVGSFYNATFDYNAGLARLVGMTRAIAGTIVALIIWLVVCLKQEKAVEIANRIFTVDKMLVTLKHICPQKFGHFKVTAIISVNFFIFVIIFWLDFWLFETLIKSIFMITIVPNMIFSWFLIQYSLILISIEIKFKTVNRGIMRLSGSNYNLIEINSSSAMKDLHDMITVHGILCDICADLTDFYSFPALLLITVSCGGILTTSYYFIAPLLANDILIWRSIDRLAYFAMEAFPIVMLSINVTRINHEMKFTTVIVHKLLSQFLPDRQFKYELETFSLRLLHQRFEFTCCGIFSLDCTLLHSVSSPTKNLRPTLELENFIFQIANMTATYLVIIIQFDGYKKTSEGHVTFNCSSPCTILDEICTLRNCSSSQYTQSIGYE